MIALNTITYRESDEPFESSVVDLINEKGIWTIDGAFIEFKEIYKQREPFN